MSRAIVVGAWLLAFPSLARAEVPADVVDACVEGFEQGQRAERRGRFLEARDQLARCMAPACPARLKAECAPMLEDIRARMPSVILARDGEVNLSQVGEVLVDDRPGPVDGRAFDLDPGEHVFRLSSGKTSETVQRTVVERGKGQRIALHCVARPMKSAASSRPIVLTASLGAVAVVGLGMFGYFGIDGLSRRADLDRCQGRCTDADVDRVESRFLLADVGLGIAVVAGAAAAAVVWFTGATSSREPDRNRRASALPASPGVLSFPGTF